MNGEVKRSRHCVYKIHYHFVFPVKYREALLDKDIERYFVDICKGIQERYEIEFEEVGLDIDHVHILCSSAPKYSPSRIITMIKSITGKKIFKEFPRLREELWGGELWTDGYYVATIGEGGNKNIIQDYIKKQGKKIEDVQLRLFSF